MPFAEAANVAADVADARAHARISEASAAAEAAEAPYPQGRDRGPPGVHWAPQKG